MPFDLATAQPVGQPSSGFNLASSQPVGQPVPYNPGDYSGELKNELANAGTINRNLAGAGTSVSNLLLRAKQALGMNVDQDIKDQRQIAQAAPVGAVLGNAALLAPTALIPGAGTAIGGAAIGAIAGALNPTLEGESTLKNAAEGAIAGGVGSAIGNKLASSVADKGEALANSASQNATMDAAVQHAADNGYALPPTMAGGSTVAKMAEGLSGKYKTNQSMGIQNQQNTQQLAKDYLGLDANSSLSPTALDALKEPQNAVYKEAASLPDTVIGQQSVKSPGTGRVTTTDITANGDDILQQLKDARFNSQMNWKHFNTTNDPAAYTAAKSYDSQASDLENTLESMAQKNDNPDLVTRLKDARVNLAKINTIDRAMNDETGQVNAQALGKMLKNGAPLDGGALDIAKFANAFPDVAKVPKSGDASPFTAADIMLAPVSMGVAPIARVAARKALMSNTVQKSMANKNYGFSLADIAKMKLSDQLPIAATSGTVAALNQ